MKIFMDSEDRMSFLRKLRFKSREYGLEIRCWCLMSNHYHLIGVPISSESLTYSIGRTNWSYVKEFNEVHASYGRLFQDRFFSTPMDECHCWKAVTYIHENPMKAGLVKLATEFEWSSARYLFGLVDQDPLIDERVIDPRFDADMSRLIQPTKEDADYIRKCTISGSPCGNDEFIEMVSDLTGVDHRPKKKGRPFNGINS